MFCTWSSPPWSRTIITGATLCLLHKAIPPLRHLNEWHWGKVHLKWKVLPVQHQQWQVGNVGSADAIMAQGAPSTRGHIAACRALIGSVLRHKRFCRPAYGHFSRAGVPVARSMQALPRNPDFLDMQVRVQNDKIGPSPDREFPPVWQAKVACCIPADQAGGFGQ